MSRYKDEAYDVSDSTDWLQTPLPSLAPVDSALRCQVCRDFYNTPMITSCSHTFCSLCIRHCLNNDAKCPACRKGDQESKLRNNYALEELVEAFKVARPKVMDLAQRKEVSVSSPKRKRVINDQEGSPVRKRTRSGTKAQRSSEMVEISESEDDDQDYNPDEVNPPQVDCPMCHDGFPTITAVQAHIEHCTGKKPRAKSTQTSFPPQLVSKANTKRPERLAQLNYSMVKDAALRKKLVDLGISAAGSRPLMEKRYTEWITLWNANCDSKIPKGRSELGRELDTWERTQGGASTSRVNLGGNIKDKDFDGSAWSKNNDDTFKDLIAQAKRRRALKTEESDSGKANESPSMGPVLPVPVSPYSSRSASVEAQSHQRSSDACPSHVDVQNNEVDTRIVPPRPASPIASSQRRIYEDLPAFEPPSSQHPNLQLEMGISSDMAIHRHLQP